MSEFDEFTRTYGRETVFDPALPAAMLAELQSSSGTLLGARPGTPPGSYRFVRQRAVSGAVTWCVAIAVVGLVDRYTTGGLWPWLVGTIGGFGYVPWNAVDRRGNNRLDTRLAVTVGALFASMFGLASIWGAVTA